MLHSCIRTATEGVKGFETIALGSWAVGDVFVTAVAVVSDVAQ